MSKQKHEELLQGFVFLPVRYAGSPEPFAAHRGGKLWPEKPSSDSASRLSVLFWTAGVEEVSCEFWGGLFNVSRDSESGQNVASVLEMDGKEPLVQSHQNKRTWAECRRVGGRSKEEEVCHLSNGNLPPPFCCSPSVYCQHGTVLHFNYIMEQFVVCFSSLVRNTLAVIKYIHA